MELEIPLNILECNFVGIPPINNIFVYPEIPDITRLERTLRETLCDYSLFSSILRDNSDKSLVFMFDPDAMRFVIESNLPTSVLGNIETKRLLEIAHTKPGSNVLSIKASSMEDGQFVLGVSISHAVADGFSLYHFLRAWAARYRGDVPHKPCQRHNFNLSHVQQSALVESTDAVPADGAIAPVLSNVKTEVRTMDSVTLEGLRDVLAGGNEMTKCARHVDCIFLERTRKLCRSQHHPISGSYTREHSRCTRWARGKLHRTCFCRCCEHI